MFAIDIIVLTIHLRQFTAFILSYHDKIQQCKEVVNFKVFSLLELLYLIITEASR